MNCEAEVKSLVSLSANSADFWRSHILTCRKSTLSQAEYCRRHNLKYHVFLYWKQKLLTPHRPAQSLKLVEVGSVLTCHTESELAKISAPQSPIRLWIDAYCVELSANFSPEALIQIIRTLRSL